MKVATQEAFILMHSDGTSAQTFLTHVNFDTHQTINVPVWPRSLRIIRPRIRNILYWSPINVCEHGFGSGGSPGEVFTCVRSGREGGGQVLNVLPTGGGGRD